MRSTASRLAFFSASDGFGVIFRGVIVSIRGKRQRRTSKIWRAVCGLYISSTDLYTLCRTYATSLSDIQ